MLRNAHTNSALQLLVLHGGVIAEDICNAGQIFRPVVGGEVVELAAEASQLCLLVSSLWLRLLLVW